LLVPVLSTGRRALGKASNAASSEIHWGKLPSGVTLKPLTQGTADDFLFISGFIAIARITAQPGSGVLSFYNDRAGLIGPRILYVEQGVMQLGPINVSPGSQPGPVLLIRKATQGEEPPQPVVVLPRTQVDCHAGDMIFFPADTAYQADNGEDASANFLEIDGFPTYTNSSGVVVEGMTAERLAVDIGVVTADPSAPPVVRIGRLTLASQTQLSTPQAAYGPQLFAIEQGALSVTGHHGKVQLRRSNVNNPGEIEKPGTALALTTGDAFLIPPGSSSTLQSSDEVSVLVLEVRAPK